MRRWRVAIEAMDRALPLRTVHLFGSTRQYVPVQRSSNLRDWEDGQTVTLGATGSELFDQTVTAPQRFYRAVEDTSNP